MGLWSLTSYFAGDFEIIFVSRYPQGLKARATVEVDALFFGAAWKKRLQRRWIAKSVPLIAMFRMVATQRESFYPRVRVIVWQLRAAFCMWGGWFGLKVGFFSEIAGIHEWPPACYKSLRISKEMQVKRSWRPESRSDGRVTITMDSFASFYGFCEGRVSSQCAAAMQPDGK